MRIGLISDTHGLLRPEAVAALQGVDTILHAGDIGDLSILIELKKITPVQAVLGNNDHPSDWPGVPFVWRQRYEEIELLMIHNIADLRPEMLSPVPTLIVHGHSHKPSWTVRDGIPTLNPGAAGHKRFNLPISVAILEVTGGDYKVAFINLLDDRELL
ncbi:MAG: metallophosphoesterase family protein [Bacteroidia bacterium]